MQKISAALVAAQKAFGPALKKTTNPHFKTQYVNLAGCIEAVIDAMNALLSDSGYRDSALSFTPPRL